MAENPASPSLPTTDDAIALIEKVARNVLDGGAIEFEEALRLIELEDPEAILFLMAWANRIRRRFRGDQVHLCSIVNAKSGGCPEDCIFCAQSVHYQTGIKTYPFLDREAILQAAQRAKENKAQALGIVAAWRGLKEGRLLDEVCQRIRELSESGTVRADASLGILESPTVAKRLKEAGLVAYNHNLETARSYFPKICSTHTYEDRVRTIRYLKEAGLKVCSGGIIGMGESRQQRVELAFELRELDVDFVPLNFLHPIPGTPLENAHDLTPMECLKTIAVFRLVLPDKEILVAGGREHNLRDLQAMMFYAGASATMVGHYLTTTGRAAEDDLRMIEDLGLSWEWSEH
ncbi:MAG: biotin synthase [Candidatus Poribacteria bacterium]|nr:MAG: biotin synthase [Candidatus Poribacteria bacterium]